MNFIGFFPSIFGSIIYLLYLAGMKSIPRAVGLHSGELITDGTYKISRNPQAMSRIIGLIGISILSRSFFTLFLATLWTSFNPFSILIEEKYLEHQFGESYLKYCSLTPRYCTLKKKRIN